MTQEDKDLLLRDLCARLPYHPIIQIYNDSWEGGKKGEYDNTLGFHHIEAFLCDRIEILPYLRPMSSMTEEEILELYKIAYDTWYCDSLYYKNDEFITFRDSIRYNALCFKSTICLPVINKVIKWLNAHHYDTYNLIEKGLAIEVTEENNPYERRK